MTKRRKRKEAEEEMKHKGQTWSIDLIVGVIIFMLVIAVFYAFLNSRNDPTIDDLQEEAGVVTTKLTKDTDIANLKIINNGEIDPAKIDALCARTYSEIKAELGIENDFCIYIEDENGNIIPCGAGGANLRAGIGNGEDVNLSGTTMCGSLI